MMYCIRLHGQQSSEWSQYRRRTLHPPVIFATNQSPQVLVSVSCANEEGLLIRFFLPRLSVERFHSQRCQEWHRPAKESTSNRTLPLCSQAIWFSVFSQKRVLILQSGAFNYWTNGLLSCFWSFFVLPLFLQTVSGVVGSELRDFRKLWSSKYLSLGLMCSVSYKPFFLKACLFLFSDLWWNPSCCFFYFPVCLWIHL